MAVDDHGLEALKKSATDIGSNPKVDYALQVMSKELFAIPKGSTCFTVEYPDTVTEIYKYRTSYPAGDVLKTITLHYATSGKKQITGAEVV